MLTWTPILFQYINKSNESYQSLVLIIASCYSLKLTQQKYPDPVDKKMAVNQLINLLIC